MTSEEMIQQMTERIVEQFDPVQVILFGSRARGQGGPDSDVDLLVVLPKIADKFEATVEVLRALRDFPTAKDIIITTPEEIARRGRLVGTVLRPALQEGKVLYERA